MKVWFIRLGKSIAVIKNEGFFRGGMRIFRSFVALFAPVGSGDILFVTGGVGDSARYRCHHVAEELRLHGFRVAITIADNPFLSRYADRFSVFVFHRTLWTSSVQKLTDALKEKRKTVLFDTDDLVFDEELFKKTAAYEAMNAFERKQYDRGIGIEFLESSFVSTITTSTPFLAEKLQKFGKLVLLVPNRLSEDDVKNAERILELGKRKEKSDGKESSNMLREEQTKNDESHMKDRRMKDDVVIGYFSGSTGHDRDFATVARVLLDFFARYPHLFLFIAGPLVLPDEFSQYSERIIRFPYVPRVEHFENLARVDINIAPLELGDPFCESKSELKFFESGIVSVPTVATATRVFREAIHDGVDGFVASNKEEWQEKLNRLISNPELRKNMGAKARETALGNYTTKNANNEEYYNFLRKTV